MSNIASFGTALETAAFGSGVEVASFGLPVDSSNASLCGLLVNNSGVTQEFLNSAVCPLGRYWGTKRYQADGDIVGNYIHTDFPDD